MNEFFNKAVYQSCFNIKQDPKGIPKKKNSIELFIKILLLSILIYL